MIIDTKKAGSILNQLFINI
jgi:hypothetical protein